MIKNEYVTEPYTGSFAATYDETVEVVNAYEWLHGPDRVTGAIRSLHAMVDNAEEHIRQLTYRRDNIDEYTSQLEAKILELEETLVSYKELS